MEMQPVSSTDLAAVGYDYENAALRIEFIKGGVYEYQGVPSDIYEGLMAATSKGQFLNQYIKKGGYPYSKL